ncbi:TIGR01212 family radical SAM protein [Deferribacter abyssi]|uniref:TIGR01212 family radical SAM protein n=1 Tax=Deferribacter abyssi TaxID=213806 RepID=UPI003C184856
MRYYTFNEFLKKKYGGKVWKIPVDAGFTCPNRDGTKGFGGCTYCNVSSFSKISTNEIKKQILDKMIKLERRKISKFIVYFQSYSNTHAPINIIKKKLESALIDSRIVALYVGTRPDCIDEEKLEYLKNINKKIDIVIEYGLQTIHNSTLQKINRASTFEEFDNALKLTRKYEIPVCAHIILGLPGENENMMYETVKYLAKEKIDFIKFHHLHIIKNTKMYIEYQKGEINLLTENQYIKILAHSLSFLPKNTVIARVVGDAPDDLLVAPKWPTSKSDFLKKLDNYMKINNLFQGKFKQC